MPQETAVPVDPSLQVNAATVLLHESEYYRGLQNPTIPLVLVQFPTNGSDQLKEPKMPPPDPKNPFQGDILLDQKEGLINFECINGIDGIGTFTLSFWDKNWTQVEKKLVNNYGRFFIKYGYREGIVNPLLITPWNSCLCLQYSLDFKLEGVIIHMTGQMQGYTLASNRQYHAKTDDAPIHEIVRKLVDDINKKDCPDDPYTLVMEEPITDVRITPEEQEDFRQMKKGFNLSDSSLQVLLKKIAPYCQNKDNIRGYRVYVRKSPKGVKELHFHTTTFSYASRHAIEGQVPLFTLFKDSLSPVINFSPDWSISNYAINGHAGKWSPEINIYNKSISFSITAKSADTDHSSVAEKEKLDKSPQTAPDPNGSRVVLPHTVYSSGGSVNRDFANSHAGFDNANILQGAYSGTLTIIGNPSFNVEEKIIILVYIPKGTDQPDIVHWISGAYLIQRIRDMITPQGYFTTFELMSAGATTVADDPISTNRNEPVQEDMTGAPGKVKVIDPKKTKILVT